MSGNFEQTGKVRVEKSGNFTQNTGKVREFQPVYIFIFFFDFSIEVYLLNRFLYLLNSLNKMLKKYWKMEKSTGKVREICQFKNVGIMNVAD